MECEQTEHGYKGVEEWQASAARRSGVKRKLGGGDVGHLRLDVAATVRGAVAALPGCHRLLAVHHPPSAFIPLCAPPDPFMNNMDEINYWVHTKRAPCLMNYDNLIKKQSETIQDLKTLNSERSIAEEVPSPKKKRRKLSLLEEDCTSVDKQQNLYFEPSQNKQRTVLSSCKSETLESDIDFNIKNSSIQNKPKRLKANKSGRTLHKKNKVVTSTPLRRSLRRAQHSSSKNDQLNVSYNFTTLNDSNVHTHTNSNQKTVQKSKKSTTRIHDLNGSINVKNNVDLANKSKINTPQNGQFEDLSDVSGFTANYIRSTKLHSNIKSNRNLRSKSSRNLVKESRQDLQKNDTKMLVCVNKSVNATAELPNNSVLNCSTDSSQNVINLITTKSNDKCVKVNKSTSLLKFVDLKCTKTKESDSNVNLDSTKQTSKTDPDISFPSRSTSNSRYPKRHKNHSTEKDIMISPCKVLSKPNVNKRRKTNITIEFNNSDRKENPKDSFLSKTRSGRNVALTPRQADNAVMVYSNSTEQVSSLNTVNVASLRGDKSRQKNTRLSHNYRSFAKKTMDQSGMSLQRERSIREKSGFAACFSDSDEGSEALKQRKFFC
uniref:Uncharacterized protein n=1 Tax=Pectinophora gossypiella TaxID=13191 RepID=A0A1E1WTD6_PECGO